MPFHGCMAKGSVSFDIFLLNPVFNFSPIFYAWLFCTKVFSTAFFCLNFRFVLFWRKIISAKAALKMLVKLTPGPFSQERFQKRHIAPVRSIHQSRMSDKIRNVWIRSILDQK
jgi:hypothetical protein